MMDTLRRGDLVVLQTAAQQTPMRVVSVQTAAGGATTVVCEAAEGGPRQNCTVETLTLYEGDLPLLWRIRSTVSVVGILLGIASCITAYKWPQVQPLKIVNSVIWTFGPPLWFIAEYCLLVPQWGNPRNKADLQYGQELASKFWLGVGALLVVIYTNKCIG